MFQYRQILARMRQGDTDRDIARARLMGRRKAGELRSLAAERGYRGSYSPVYRMIAAIRAVLPPDATVPLLFAPAEAAQVAHP